MTKSKESDQKNREELIQTLRDADLKVTVPRISILDIFQQGGHYTAESIYSMLRSKQVDASLATVYRVLNNLTEAGLLQATNISDDKKLYEILPKEHHDHILCRDCGMIIEFVDEKIETRQEKIALRFNMKIVSHSLNLYTECLDDNCPNKLRVSE